MPMDYWCQYGRDCPTCFKLRCPPRGEKMNDGRLNLYKATWFVCHKHRVKWWVGWDIYDDWKKETDEVWKMNAEILGDYEEIGDLTVAWSPQRHPWIHHPQKQVETV